MWRRNHQFPFPAGKHILYKEDNRALSVILRAKNSAIGLALSVALFFRMAVPLYGGAFVVAAESGTTLPDTLRYAMASCEGEVDLSAFEVTAEALGGVLAEVLQDAPELFHVDGRFSYTYGENGRVLTVRPIYTMVGEELARARMLYLQAVEGYLRALDEARGDAVWREAEVVLFLHDALAERCAYDEEGVLAGGGRANAYELLRDGRGICQAYALAFMALCRGAGLEADFVCSPDMDHAWNHVRVDGMWYHVDVTHDDPVPSAEEEGAVYHHRWLRSDAGMDTLGYHGYTCAQEHTCADTRYEQGGAGALSSFSAPVRYTPVGWAVESLDRLPALFSVTGNPSAGVIRHAAGDLDGDGQVGVADLVLCRQFFGDREVWADALRRSILNG